MELRFIISGLIEAAPGIIIWLAALVLSLVLLKREVGQSQRLLIAGSAFMLLGSLLGIPKLAVASYLAQTPLSNVRVASVVSFFNLPNLITT